MYRLIRDFVRKKRLKKYINDIPTGFIPMNEVATVSVIVDVEEPGFDEFKEEILAWGRRTGLKVSIFFFDFRKLGKEELLLTSITNTILRKDLDWTGMPDLSKVSALVEEKSDLLISMIDNHEFPIDFLAKCTKARFKIGRHAYKGHPYDMILSGGETADLRSDAKEIFSAITEFITKIK